MYANSNYENQTKIYLHLFLKMPASETLKIISLCPMVLSECFKKVGCKGV